MTEIEPRVMAITKTRKMEFFRNVMRKETRELGSDRRGGREKINS